MGLPSLFALKTYLHLTDLASGERENMHEQTLLFSCGEVPQVTHLSHMWRKDQEREGEQGGREKKKS